MTTLQEQRLATFVDRADEVARFCEVLDDQSRAIMVVWGEGGIGKSSLLARMIHECANRNIRKAEVVWTDIRSHNYLAIMRKIRDDAGPENFLHFTDLINYFTVPQYELKITIEGAGIRVAEGAEIKGSSTGVIAGVVIKDCMLGYPRNDINVPEDERRIRLTDCFLDDLAAATGNNALVIFFDAIEKMTFETERWVSEELIGGISQGWLPNVKLVLCGRRKPDLGECRLIAEESELKPFLREHIVEYLEKSGITDGRDAIADLLLLHTKGKLLDIASSVKYLLQAKVRAGKGP